MVQTIQPTFSSMLACRMVSFSGPMLTWLLVSYRTHGLGSLV
uniref:Splicing factor, putative n=1 Tax=Arundo donax TaxID=35708 RepID=A0A0A9F0B6_ARUDO